VVQQARELTACLHDREQPVRFVIRDRDSKFAYAFDTVFQSDGARIVRTPIGAPAANSFAEGWVGSVRRECLDRQLIVGSGHLRRVLDEFVQHYNGIGPPGAAATAATHGAGSEGAAVHQWTRATARRPRWAHTRIIAGRIAG
jgi:hypothetical protein